MKRLLAAIACMSGAVSPAHATRCFIYPSADAQVPIADAIFLGRADGTVGDGEEAITSFALVSPLLTPRAWEHPPDRIEVRHCDGRISVADPDAEIVVRSCPRFQEGEEYLVVAMMGDDRQLHTSVCAAQFSEYDYRVALGLAPRK